MGDENTNEYRKEVINQIIKKTKEMYEEVVKYEHCENNEVKKVMKSVIKELKLASKELHDWSFIKSNKAKIVLFDEKLSDIKHHIYSDKPSQRLIDNIKTRWNII